MKKMMRRLRTYFRDHLGVFWMYLLFTAVFMMIFALFALPIIPVLYASGICFVIGACLFAAGFIGYWNKCERLDKLLELKDIDLALLPEPTTSLDLRYTQILQGLETEKKQLISTTDKARTELVDYFTIWAHQVKTPLSAMRLLMQTTMEKADLETELQKTEQYVGMVLGYLRLDGNDFQFREYPLQDIVRGEVKKFAKMFIRSKIRLEIEEMDQYVLTDRKWLAFIIEQLLSNALKYTKDSIRIYCRETALFIEDNGIGISEEDLPRVFEKGYTGYTGRQYAHSTGIGLYLCKRTAKRLGITLEISSMPAKWTRVKLDLYKDRDMLIL